MITPEESNIQHRSFKTLPCHTDSCSHRCHPALGGILKADRAQAQCLCGQQQHQGSVTALRTCPGDIPALNPSSTHTSISRDHLLVKTKGFKDFTVLSDLLTCSYHFSVGTATPRASLQCQGLQKMSFKVSSNPDPGFCDSCASLCPLGSRTSAKCCMGFLKASHELWELQPPPGPLLWLLWPLLLQPLLPALQGMVFSYRH